MFSQYILKFSIKNLIFLRRCLSYCLSGSRLHILSNLMYRILKRNNNFKMIIINVILVLYNSLSDVIVDGW